MQYISKERGVNMFSSPRYHCEVAGGGIEYAAWGYAKFCYRHIPLSKKNTADRFRECVKEVLSSNNTISAERVRRFSRRARRYICCYFVLHKLHEEQSSHLVASESNINLKDIEKMVKNSKLTGVLLTLINKLLKMK